MFAPGAKTDLRTKYLLARSLLTQDRAFGPPIYVTLDITSRCNQHCLGCQFQTQNNGGPFGQSAQPGDLSWEILEILANDLAALGTRHLILIGEGEPLLHPAIVEIVTLLKGRGFKVTLFSNGSMLNQKVTGELLRAGLDVLHVSLWGNSAETYQRNVDQGPDRYHLVLANLRRLATLKADRRSRGPYTILHMPLNRHNFREIGQRLDLGYSLSCDEVSFSPFVAWSPELEHLALTPPQVAEVCGQLQKARALLEQPGVGHNLDDALLRFQMGRQAWQKVPCYIAWYHARIKVDGTVWPCGTCPVPMGNLGQSSFAQIWNGEAMRRFRRQGHYPGRWASGSLCDYCCDLGLNLKVGRRARWLRVFSRLWGQTKPKPAGRV